MKPCSPAVSAALSQSLNGPHLTRPSDVLSSRFLREQPRDLPGSLDDHWDLAPTLLLALGFESEGVCLSGILILSDLRRSQQEIVSHG